ncbi:hypothetical protein WN55_04810 [Dufourea novaeangliae]|uniref:Uncharacterized protein n=1 Tax=Dufourea novaeangliae TaxID=178035 RepID=A0A154PLH9_DUFNO|nr:hypothetical protein WN55_04810 [Dufourea novaeangliae]
MDGLRLQIRRVRSLATCSKRPSVKDQGEESGVREKKKGMGCGMWQARVSTVTQAASI